MKRPLALIGLTSMLVLTVCFYADAIWLKVIFALSLAGLIITLAFKKLRKKPEPYAFLSVIIICILGFNMFSQFYVKPIGAEYSGKEAEITATLIEEPQSYGGTVCYTVRTRTIDGNPEKVKILIYSDVIEDCQVADTIEFSAKLKSIDYGKYLADRIYLRGNVYGEAQVSEPSLRPFYYYIVKIRQCIRESIYENLDYDVADFASAVLLGDGMQNAENYDTLRRAGLTHIVVVSGLHLSIIVACYAKIISRKVKNKYINISVAVLLILLFLFITGFGKSTVRAAIMLFVILSSKLFKRRGDSLNSLGFAAILMSYINPYIAGDLGVLLSFSATFGIVVFSVPLTQFLTKWLKPEYLATCKRINKSVRMFFEQLSVTITAVFCTLPVTVLFFGKVSLVQILSNLIIAPLIKWFMLSVALCLITSFIPVYFTGGSFAFIANVIGKVILYMAKKFASLPMAYVKADYVFVVFWIFASILIFTVAYILRRNGKGLHFLCIFMSTMIFLSGFLGQVMVSYNKITVFVTPSEAGQSIILSSKEGNVLICSSDTFDSTLYTEEILENIYTEKQLAVFASENIWEYDHSLFDYTEVLMYDNICKEDLRINLWDKGTLSIIERQGEVYQYIDFDEKSMLILPSKGDASVLPEDMRSADVLITSGRVDNMELLSFHTLYSNGDDFKAAAVVDYFKNRDINPVMVSDTVNLNIVG